MASNVRYVVAQDVSRADGTTLRHVRLSRENARLGRCKQQLRRIARTVPGAYVLRVEDLV